MNSSSAGTFGPTGRQRGPPASDWRGPPRCGRPGEAGLRIGAGLLLALHPMPDPKDFMAAERTLLAWVRTGIALMGFGFVVARFGLFLRELVRVGERAAAQRFDSVLLGTLIVAAGVGVNIWASLRHRTLVRRLRAGVTEISSLGPVRIGVATGVGGAILIVVLIEAALR